jgi:hypothetical protein
MRISGAVLSAAAVAALLPALAFGQFQAPTQDELKMTSDPKAPGAAAVYLNIEEIADDGLHYRSFYQRIKVLTEKGKELATVEVPYAGDFKVKAIEGRTIHPDGAVIPLKGKPEDLLTAKSGDFKVGRKVFTLPDVTVGSILEYRYQLEYPDGTVSSPFWRIQRKYFVHKAHYMFTPFKSFLNGSQNVTSHYITDTTTGEVLDHLLWWQLLPPGTPPVKSDAMGRLTLDVSDVPPIPDEEYMPPIDSVLYRVYFYYKAQTTAQDFWTKVASRWSKDTDHFAEPSRTLREAVAGIVAPTDSELDKAKKIYIAVQALDNTDYSREKTTTERKALKLKSVVRAEDVWKQKSGDSNDIALLYLAMLRAAGLKAWGLQVVNRGRAIFDPTYMDGDQFDDTLVILETGGNQILLDPGTKMCAFQTVSWQHSDSGALRQSAQGAGFTKTPPQTYQANSIGRTGDITIDEHGAITGYFNIVMKGEPALHWRQIAVENDTAELKKRFDDELQDIVPAGIDAHVDHFLAIDQPDNLLMAIVKMKGSMGSAMGQRLLLPGLFFESRGHLPFVKEEKRLEPVDMRFPESVTEQVTYHLPAGFSAEGAPQQTDVPWKGHALYVVKSQSSPGEVVVARELVRGFDMAKPDEYQDLRGFYQKVATGDEQEIVLRATPPVKGE